MPRNKNKISARHEITPSDPDSTPVKSCANSDKTSSDSTGGSDKKTKVKPRTTGVKIRRKDLKHYINSTLAKDCGPGKHQAIIVHPDVPEEEKTVEGRLAKMKQILKEMKDNATTNKQRKTASDFEHEIAAAEFNVLKGHISSGDEMSRPRDEEETKSKAPSDFQTIRAICVKCGHDREIDHATTEGDHTSRRFSTGEAKNKPSPKPSTGKQNEADINQIKNNAKLAADGHRVTYKVTDKLSNDKYMEAAEAFEKRVDGTEKGASQRVRVVQVTSTSPKEGGWF